MTRFDKIAARRSDLKTAEAKGIVADSQEVRLALMQEFHNGTKTLEQVQSELAKIKRDAKKNGKLTRNQAYIGKTL